MLKVERIAFEDGLIDQRGGIFSYIGNVYKRVLGANRWDILKVCVGGHSRFYLRKDDEEYDWELKKVYQSSHV